MTELVVPFLLGGALVSLFAALGSAFNPKTFAGIFAASPAVALGSLAIAFERNGELQVEVLARSMALGAIALLAYALVCACWVRLKHAPVALGAIVAWGAWGAVAAVLFKIVSG